MVKVGEHNYQIGRISPMKQFHVVRRLGTVIGALGAIVELARGSGGGIEALVAQPMTAIEPLMRALGEMSDANAEFVISTCLSAVQRQQEGGTGWAPVHVGGQLMFQDIDMQQMLTLVWEVLQANLANFISEPLSTSEAGMTERTASPGPTSQMASTG